MYLHREALWDYQFRNGAIAQQCICLPNYWVCSKVTLGDKLSINVQPEGVLLKAARPCYSLADLLAQYDLLAAKPTDMAVWSQIKPIGCEAR